MKRISLILVFAIVLSLVVPFSALGASTNPTLDAISFKNATLDVAFNSDVLEYTITLDDNTEPPTLESYKITGDAKLFIDYITDDANHQTGITATVSFDTGGGVTYAFLYSNPPEYRVTSDNSLLAIYCEFGELNTPLNDEDTSYVLYIPSDLKEITILPTPSDINAYCPKYNAILSDNAVTPISLNCVASDGTSKTYKIKIKRINKTVAQVTEEMQDPDYVSFVDGIHFYEKASFYVVAGSVVGGGVLLFFLLKLLKKVAVNPYDKDEKPFYSSVE